MADPTTAAADVSDAPSGGRPRRVDRWVDRWPGLRPALQGWVLARVVVALVLVEVVVTATRHRLLLLDWDAQWYLRIAEHGYAGIPGEGIRFFPLTPLLARWTSWLFLGHTDWSLVAWANAAALVYGVLLWRLVHREFRDVALADRTAWVVALEPVAFVLVMGYAEALFGVLAVWFVSAVRSRRWWWAVPAGVLAGLDRPVAVLLCAHVLVEAVVMVRRSAVSPRQVVGALAAMFSPVVGTVAFCVWVGLRFGDPLLPFTTQDDPRLRGGIIATPLAGLEHAWHSIYAPGYFWGNVFLLPTLLVLLGLLVVVARRQPASFTAWAAVTLAAALTSREWGSLLRYAMSAFPFVIAVAQLGTTPRRWRVVLLVSVAFFVLLALAALSRRWVP